MRQTLRHNFSYAFFPFYCDSSFFLCFYYSFIFSLFYSDCDISLNRLTFPSSCSNVNIKQSMQTLILLFKGCRHVVNKKPELAHTYLQAFNGIFTRCLQDIYRMFTGYLQDIYRIFTGCLQGMFTGYFTGSLQYV